jgi:hypothetical protein
MTRTQSARQALKALDTCNQGTLRQMCASLWSTSWHPDGVTSVFVFCVSDIDADNWRAEVAVAADTRTEAYRILRGRGVHRKQFDNESRPIRVLAWADVGGWLMDPTRVYRRRDNAVGWTAWEPVPDDVSLDWRISGKARRLGPGGRIL